MGTNSLRFRCMAYSPMLLRQEDYRANEGAHARTLLIQLANGSLTLFNNLKDIPI